jgi:hypothetical protein
VVPGVARPWLSRGVHPLAQSGAAAVPARSSQPSATQPEASSRPAMSARLARAPLPRFGFGQPQQQQQQQQYYAPHQSQQQVGAAC